MKIVINKGYGGFGLSDKAQTMLDIKYYLAERHHPKLIEIVEQLGEKANGQSANLEVIEIPDGLGYKIEKDDGWESIETFLGVTVEQLSNGLTTEQIELVKQASYITVIGEECDDDDEN